MCLNEQVSRPTSMPYPPRDPGKLQPHPPTFSPSTRKRSECPTPPPFRRVIKADFSHLDLNIEQAVTEIFCHCWIRIWSSHDHPLLSRHIMKDFWIIVIILDISFPSVTFFISKFRFKWRKKDPVPSCVFVILVYKVRLKTRCALYLQDCSKCHATGTMECKQCNGCGYDVRICVIIRHRRQTGVDFPFLECYSSPCVCVERVLGL